MQPTISVCAPVPRFRIRTHRSLSLYLCTDIYSAHVLFMKQFFFASFVRMVRFFLCAARIPLQTKRKPNGTASLCKYKQMRVENIDRRWMNVRAFAYQTKSRRAHLNACNSTKYLRRCIFCIRINRQQRSNNANNLNNFFPLYSDFISIAWARAVWCSEHDKKR